MNIFKTKEEPPCSHLLSSPEVTYRSVAPSSPASYLYKMSRATSEIPDEDNAYLLTQTKDMNASRSPDRFHVCIRIIH